MAQHRLGLVLVLASSLMGTQLPTGLAAAGDLDTSFSVDGKVITDLTGKWDLAWAVALQTDGKIIAAGASSGSGGRFSLIRYATDGSLDATFSDDGKVLTNFTSGDDWAYDVAIQADGKIVAAGVVAGQGGRFGLARYESNGALDTSFGGDGRVVTNFTSGWDAATGVGVQADGKIVAAGSASGAGGRYGTARYEVADALQAPDPELTDVKRQIPAGRTNPRLGQSATSSTSSHAPSSMEA